MVVLSLHFVGDLAKSDKVCRERSSVYIMEAIRIGGHETILRAYSGE
jgi:hypothetical protein